MDAGNFSPGGRLLTSLKENGIFYAVLAGLGVVGLLSILFFGNLTLDSLSGFGIALSNGQGLFIGIFLLGAQSSHCPPPPRIVSQSVSAADARIHPWRGCNKSV